MTSKRELFERICNLETRVESLSDQFDILNDIVEESLKKSKKKTVKKGKK